MLKLNDSDSTILQKIASSNSQLRTQQNQDASFRHWSSSNLGLTGLQKIKTVACVHIFDKKWNWNCLFFTRQSPKAYILILNIQQISIANKFTNVKYMCFLCIFYTLYECDCYAYYLYLYCDMRPVPQKCYKTIQWALKTLVICFSSIYANE